MKKVIVIFAISAAAVLTSCGTDSTCTGENCADSTVVVTTDSADFLPAVETSTAVVADSVVIK